MMGPSNLSNAGAPYNVRIGTGGLREEDEKKPG